MSKQKYTTDYTICCDYCKTILDSRKTKIFLLTKDNKNDCLLWCIDCFIDNQPLAISKGWHCEDYVT